MATISCDSAAREAHVVPSRAPHSERAHAKKSQKQNINETKTKPKKNVKPHGRCLHLRASSECRTSELIRLGKGAGGGFVDGMLMNH